VTNSRFAPKSLYFSANHSSSDKGSSLCSISFKGTPSTVGVRGEEGAGLDEFHGCEVTVDDGNVQWAKWRGWVEQGAVERLARMSFQSVLCRLREPGKARAVRDVVHLFY